jgi:hypothetical protein
MLARVRKLAIRLCVYSAALFWAAWGLSLFLWIGYDAIHHNFEWQFVSTGGWMHMRVTDVSEGAPPGDRATDVLPGLIAIHETKIMAEPSDVDFAPTVPRYPNGSPITVEVNDGVVGFFAPYWILAGLTSIVPGVHWTTRLLAKRRRERLKGLQLCRRCGYDLRASTGRCPECGGREKGS